LGLARTDEEWSAKLEAALTASRRADLEHGTNAAYIHGCVCYDCRRHQQVRMGRNRSSVNAGVVHVLNVDNPSTFCRPGGWPGSAEHVDSQRGS
jgi:hypothetical protein